MRKHNTLPVGIAASIALPLTILSYPEIAQASAPVASDASASIGAGDSAVIELSDYITDADDNVRLSLIDLDPSTPNDENSFDTADGEWSVGSTGRLRFNPAEGFGGTTTISYTVMDRDGNLSNVASISVSVVNPVPVATDAAVTAGAGESAVFELSDYVTDPDDNIRFATTDFDPSTPDIDDDLTTADGDWSVGTSGRVRFNPVEGFSGVATVPYAVSDDEGNLSNTATISVSVTNPAPVATDVAVTIAAGDSAVFELSDYVTDPDNNIRFVTTDFDPSTADIDDDLTTADGDWSVGTSGRVRFNPAEGFSGVATIPYAVGDDEGNVSNTATISVSVTNPAPVASDVSTSVIAGESAVLELSESVTDSDDNIRFSTVDFDPSTASIENSLDTAGGSWSVGTSGRVRFNPADGFSGVATAPYAVGDDEGNVSNTAAIRVTVTNPAPVASDVAATAGADDDSVVIELSEYVTDSDDNIRFSTTDFNPETTDIEDSLETADGLWTVGTSGRVRFRPADTFSGVATVPYVVSDDEGNISNVASVSITVPFVETIAEAQEAETPDAKAENPETEEQPAEELSTEEQPAEGEGSTEESTATETPDATTPENSTTEETDTDADGDGISDSVEGSADSDSDGVQDYLDVDSDNDGISDAVETAADRDGDGIANFRDLDVDNDGIFDIVEARIGMTEVNQLDTDLNGVIDLTFAMGANGMADIVETTAESGVENYTLPDIDSDGVADYRDHDSDNDGLLDTLESDHNDRDLDGTVDDTAVAGVDRTIAAVGTSGLLPSAGGAPRNTDADGLADFRDGDSDNDGLTDAAESFGVALDANGDGRLDDFIDADGDGVNDAEPTVPADTNGNGAFDAVEVDSDGDGISDLLEAGGTDANGDGIVDGFLDDDADGIDDGINALPLTPADTDSDNIPDFQDTDSDNDGLSDLIETGGTDSDGDGNADSLVSAVVDANNDGVADYLQNGDSPGLQEANGEILTGLAGGAGCSIGGSGGTDPLLPGMFMLSMLWIARRFRQLRG
jgi:hypothetical protein